MKMRQNTGNLSKIKASRNKKIMQEMGLERNDEIKSLYFLQKLKVKFLRDQKRDQDKKGGTGSSAW